MKKDIYKDKQDDSTSKSCN